jgi:hypothetical protein
LGSDGITEPLRVDTGEQVLKQQSET